MQHAQSVRAAKMMGFWIGACGHKVGTILRELMHRCVWPRNAVFRHGARIVKTRDSVESFSKAPEGWRTPRRFAKSGSCVRSAGLLAGPLLFGLAVIYRTRTACVLSRRRI